MVNLISPIFLVTSYKLKSESRSVIPDYFQPHGPYSLWNSPGQNTGVGSLSLLQGIFIIQESNPDLLNCRWILNQLSHKGNLSQFLHSQIILKQIPDILLPVNIYVYISKSKDSLKKNIITILLTHLKFSYNF